MAIYCGVDFHPRQHSVSYCDSADGELRIGVVATRNSGPRSVDLGGGSTTGAGRPGEGDHRPTLAGLRPDATAGSSARSRAPSTTCG